MKITIDGKPSCLEGQQVSVGEKAPHFEVFNASNEAITLETVKGKKTLISVFPNINTSVCDVQTRKFFESLLNVKDIHVLNISNNSLEELANWCATTGLKVPFFSDSKLSFAKAFGLFIPELKLLTRAVFVLNEEGVVEYMEIVPEVVHEPNYEAALAAL